MALTKAPDRTQSDVLITGIPTLSQDMSSHNPTQWEMSHWSNGNPFDATWQRDNVQFRDGVMILRLDNAGCPSQCDNKPFASGEYRTREERFGFGRYEARLKAASGAGTVTSFFTYRGVYGQPSHHEIDFEVLGRNCHAVQTNYYVEGRGHHEQMIPLPFDACSEFHNYGFEWSREALVFYVDGREVRRVTEDSGTPHRDIPFEPGKIMVNFWPGTAEVNGWLGPFTYPGRPQEARYDWIKFAEISQNPAR